jgi:uncharacterized alpha-E superfamily protein
VSLRASRELAASFGNEGDARPDETRVALLATAGLAEYERRYGAITEDGLATFMVVDRDNDSSVLSCLSMARMNARAVRDAISSEMWEELNRAYLAFHRVTTAYLLIDGLSDFCRQVRLASQTFQGVAAATMPHDEGWHFLQTGIYLERASMTARILQARAGDIDADGAAGWASPEQVHRWLSLLRSVSGYEAYMRLVHGGVQPAAVAEFLLSNLAFPRSVAFGVHRVVEELNAIELGLGRHALDGAGAAAAGLAARLRNVGREELLAEGVGAFVVFTEQRCNAIGAEIRGAYFENVDAALAAASAT